MWKVSCGIKLDEFEVQKKYFFLHQAGARRRIEMVHGCVQAFYYRAIFCSGSLHPFLASAVRVR
jgi:hypothetical protein